MEGQGLQFMTKPKWMFWEKHFINPSKCLPILPKGTLFRDESEKKQKQNFSHIQERSLSIFFWKCPQRIWLELTQWIPWTPNVGAKFNIGAKFSFLSIWTQIVIRCKISTLKVLKVSVMCLHIFSENCILGGFVRRFKEHWLFHRGLFEQSLMWCNLALKQIKTGPQTLGKSKSSQFGLTFYFFGTIFFGSLILYYVIKCFQQVSCSASKKSKARFVK